MASCIFYPDGNRFLGIAEAWLTSRNTTYGTSNLEAILSRPRVYFEWDVPHDLTDPNGGYPVRLDYGACVREVVLCSGLTPNLDHADIINLKLPNNKPPTDLFFDLLSITNVFPENSFYYYDPCFIGAEEGTHSPIRSTTPRAIRAVASALQKLIKKSRMPVSGYKAFLMNFNNPWLKAPLPQRLYVSYLG
jgi:hypothetical protein